MSTATHYVTVGQPTLTTPVQEDIHYVLEQNDRLHQEHRKLSNILNHLNCIVAMTNPTKKLIFVNQYFFDTFAFDNFEGFKEAHECICNIFKPAQGYIQPQMGEEDWITYVIERPYQTHKVLIDGRGGEELIFDLKIRKVEDDDLYVVTLSDITELEYAKKKAQMLAQLKGEFLANMSHEIRTPMNAILGFTDLLSKSRLDAQQKRYLNIIDHSTQTLLGIINDILDFSKIESGKLELELTSINPFVELYQISQLFTTQMKDKAITFQSTIDPTMHECFSADLLRLQQIISNLLSNAIKFTPAGGNIAFYASLLSQDESNIRLRMGVRDSGIGISALQRKRIFKAFSQADGSITRQFGGTGLGLSISARLVGLMGGELELESVEGEGSHFYFDVSFPICQEGKSLPSLYDARSLVIVKDPKKTHVYEHYIRTYLEQLHVPYQIHLEGSTPPQSMHKGTFIIFCDTSLEMIDELLHLEGTIIMVCNDVHRPVFLPNITTIYDLEHNLSALYNALFHAIKYYAPKEPTTSLNFEAKVLVAEDNDVNQLLIREYLERYALTPVVVDNGRKALNEALRGGYDLILMDVNMPIMSGIDATMMIKSHGVGTPIIALTANAMAGDREKFLDCGFDGYLAKPIAVAELEGVLQRYLPACMEHHTHLSQPQTVLVEEPNQWVDMELIERELPLSKAVIAKLLNSFLENAPTYCAALEGALDGGEAQKILETSHNLVGVAGNLRLKAIEEASRVIETLARTAKEGGEVDYREAYGRFTHAIHSTQEELKIILRG